MVGVTDKLKQVLTICANLEAERALPNCIWEYSSIQALCDPMAKPQAYQPSCGQ